MMRMPDSTLDRRIAHLWYVFPDAVRDPALLGAYQQLLSPEERVQQQRFYFAAGRHEYLVTRALVRTVLSRYVEVNPSIWRFKKNAYGKPAIAYPREIPPLTFNLAHTSGLIVCLVALGRDIGVDVEDITRPGETVEIAEQFFSPTEVAALRALPPHAQRSRFFEYWTLKEAYIKARGLGLTLPLEQFSFHLEAGHPIRVAFAPCLLDDPRGWQFAQFQPTSRHQMATAIRHGTNAALTILPHYTIPLVS
jgi:4'-phosphopantetheinyl transferase